MRKVADLLTPLGYRQGADSTSSHPWASPSKLPMRLVSRNSKSISSSFAIRRHSSTLMPAEEPSAFLILNGGPTVMPTMSFCLGIGAIERGAGGFSSGSSASFRERAREHRTGVQIAARRALFMQVHDRAFPAGSDL